MSTTNNNNHLRLNGITTYKLSAKSNNFSTIYLGIDVDFTSMWTKLIQKMCFKKKTMFSHTKVDNPYWLLMLMKHSYLSDIWFGRGSKNAYQKDMCLK